jgi:hypothetical protein
MEQVPVELDGNFLKTGVAFMGEPGMWDIGAYQHEFIMVNFFHTIPHHSFYTLSVFNEIQLVFLMVMNGEIEFCLVSGENREAISLCKRGAFFEDGPGHNRIKIGFFSFGPARLCSRTLEGNSSATGRNSSVSVHLLNAKAVLNVMIINTLPSVPKSGSSLALYLTTNHNTNNL